ncbi:hypothetical protein BDV93DRAFT_557973 [Ceratobasidium sp. AG-I]|nr:hypothetical protein BDV93DRAFT_557973 [Ceratobasidium sp. AG-I]
MSQSAIGLSGQIGPSLEKAFAWSSSGGRTGRFRIQFPLNQEWYDQQNCTEFSIMEHHRVPGAAKHEFIVLVLKDNSHCRLERRSGLKAVFDAVNPQGTTAYDVIQWFEAIKTPNHADFHGSKLISRVEFAVPLDLLTVFHICRAIQEGEKTSKYTLLLFNCYFFSLAIQSTLTRLVAEWDDVKDWHSVIVSAVPPTKTNNQTLLADALRDDSLSPSPTTNLPPTSLSFFSYLGPPTGDLFEAFAQKMENLLATDEEKLKLNKDLDTAMDSVLWHWSLSSAVDDTIEGKARESMISVLSEYLHAHFPRDGRPTAAGNGVLPHTSISNDSNPSMDTLAMETLEPGEELVGHFKRVLFKLVRAAADAHVLLSSVPKKRRIERYRYAIGGDPVNVQRPPSSTSAGISIRGMFRRILRWLSLVGFLIIWAYFIVVGVLQALLSHLKISHKPPTMDSRLKLIMDVLGDASKASPNDLVLACSQINRERIRGHRWTFWPWDEVYLPMREEVLSQLVQAAEPALQVQISPDTHHQDREAAASAVETQEMTVALFQNHLRNRIKDHARRASRTMLVSKEETIAELETKLSEVWVGLRDSLADIDETNANWLRIMFDLMR